MPKKEIFSPSDDFECIICMAKGESSIYQCINGHEIHTECHDNWEKESGNDICCYCRCGFKIE